MGHGVGFFLDDGDPAPSLKCSLFEHLSSFVLVLEMETFLNYARNSLKGLKEHFI